ncbi:MAG: hypothetical protein KIT09_36065 [Bryobacteraceae bacterium]|nr:hypothetical protein [Bryobacteraceae bacterium]
MDPEEELERRQEARIQANEQAEHQEVEAATSTVGRRALTLANSATGKVSRIYPSTRGTAIRLHVPEGTPVPLFGYFNLRQTHPNYNALYSLALVAAVNRYNLRIRATTEIDPTVEADVSYMVIDWLP